MEPATNRNSDTGQVTIDRQPQESKNHPSRHEQECLALFLADAPIFLQPWWLNAASSGHWSYAKVIRDKRLAAVMPYTKQRSPLGYTILGMPPLTMFLGPWLRISKAKYPTQLAEQKELMTELIDDLPPHSLFAQKFHYGVTNWLPFYWRGFTQTTRYSYVLDNLRDLGAIWENMRSEARRDIRKAQQNVKIVDHLGIERFLEINEMTFRRQNLRFPYSAQLVSRLDEACRAQNAGKMLFAVDVQERIHAAIYIVWTRSSTFLLMSGADPALRSSCANSLLIWEAIRFASTVSDAFDFEGSMIEPIESFFRSFSPIQKPFSAIHHDVRSPILRATHKVCSGFSKLARRARQRMRKPAPHR